MGQFGNDTSPGVNTGITALAESDIEGLLIMLRQYLAAKDQK